jgi:hypothetical protein
VSNVKAGGIHGYHQLKGSEIQKFEQFPKAKVKQVRVRDVLMYAWAF